MEISQINKRYVKANNIYMGAEFDASKESSYLMYLDGKYILFKKFVFFFFSQYNVFSLFVLNEKKLTICTGTRCHNIYQVENINGFQRAKSKRNSTRQIIKKNTNSILNLKDDSDTGYICEVDLDYPAELHNKHNDFPFCAEKRTIPGVTKYEKLMLTLYDKKKLYCSLSNVEISS